MKHNVISEQHNEEDSPPKKCRIETTSETQVRPGPTPAAGCAGSDIQTEVANDNTVSIISDYEEHDVNYEMKDYRQHIFYPEPLNLKREFTPR